MSDVRWEGFSHEEIYSRVQQGPGPLASADAEAAWSTVESTIRTVDAQLTRAVKQIGAGWQGRAAEAVQGGMTVMSNWALDAAGDASLTKNGISAQAEQAGRLRSAMPPPRTAEWNRIVQEEVPGVGLMSAMGDLGALEEQMADDHAVAVEMMNRYSSQSSDNQRLMNYWTQPPTVVVEAASARSTTSTAPLGAAGAVGARSGGASGQVRRPVVRRVAAASTRRRPPCRLRSGSRTSTGAAPSSGRRGGAGTPAEIGPPNGERSGRVGSAAVPGRAPGAVDPYADAPVGRRGTVPGTAADRGGPAAGPRTSAIPVGVRPGAEGRAPGAVGRWPRSDPSVGGGVRPVVPGPPARPGGAADWRTGLRTAPATPPTPPSRRPGRRAPPLPASANRRPAPPVPPRKPPPSGWPRDARPPRATGSCRWAVRCGPRSRRTRGAAYLIDDTDAFADDRWFPPPVISGDALVSPRGG